MIIKIPQETPETIDLGDKVLTKENVVKEYDRLIHKDKLKAKETYRLKRIKKYGDDALYQNTMNKGPNRPSKVSTLKILNSTVVPQKEEKIQQVIDDIFDGMNMIEACEIHDIKPRYFLNMLEKEEYREFKEQFINARISLAEYYLFRREKLEKDLLEKKIDTPTYSALSSDYKYLAAKLAPLAYGDKIQFDAQINKTNRVEVVNSEKVLELNKLLTQNIVDAEFEEEK